MIRIPEDPRPAKGKPPKIGYLLRMYPRFSQTFVVNEILELERQGMDVSIASLRKPTDGRFQESISRVRARVDYIPELFVEAPSKFAKTHWAMVRRQPRSYARATRAALRHRGAQLTDLLQAAMVLRWARKRKLQHVHVHFGTQEASVAYLANLIGGLGYSLTLHAFDIFRENVDRTLLTHKINESRFTVTVSQYNHNFLTSHFPGVNPDKIRVNYNGIDLDRFKPNGTQRTPRAILGVGRLIEKKGFIYLIRAVKQLRDQGLQACCTIIGDGPEQKRLQEEIKRLKLGEAVTLAGSLSQDKVRDSLSKSTCFALPCVSAADGNADALPTVLLEAMASGCPSVSTTLSGVPEIIEHGHHGLLVPPGDASALAAAVGSILDEPQLGSRLARGGRRRVEARFDVRHRVACMASWFDEAIITASKRPKRRRPASTPSAEPAAAVEHPS